MWVLAEAAIKILGAPVTSAFTERTFSTFGWIHSKNGNRLTSDKAAMVTYLAHNWKLIHATPKSQKRIEQQSGQGEEGKVGDQPFANKEEI